MNYELSSSIWKNNKSTEGLEEQQDHHSSIWKSNTSPPPNHLEEHHVTIIQAFERIIHP